ncbi:MAG: MBL fold metallo-hydrolase, partial [Chitinophagaceae bacterium]
MSVSTTTPVIAQRAERIAASANFKNGSFVNLSPTQMKPADVSWLTMLGKSLRRPKDTRPDHPLTAMKRSFQPSQNLRHSTGEETMITWFGHSSYLIQIGGKNILVDPVFSGHASPVSFMVKAFDGANTFGAEDMPTIDVLLITHDHYDHLDVET